MCARKPLLQTSAIERLDPVLILASPMMLLMGENNPLARLDVVDFARDLRDTTMLFVSEETYALAAPRLTACGVAGKVVEPNAGLIQSLLESDNMVFPTPRHHASSVQTSSIAARRIEGYPLCGVSAVVSSSRRSRFVDEVNVWFKTAGPFKGSRTWESLLRSPESISEGSYLFLPPEKGSPVWNISCPFAPADAACCAHCRQAHPE